MKRLPRPGLASLEWSSLAANTGTFGAGKPEGHSVQDGCFCAGSSTTSILTNGRARQSLAYRSVRRQAGAPAVASSRTAALTKPRKPKKTGSCDRFQQEPSQDRGLGRARRKTADAPRRPGTGERRARFPVRRKPVRRNEPGPVAMGRGRSRTGGRARFSASISCRNGSPAACLRPVSAKPAFRNGRKRPDWPLEARRRSFQGPLDRTARRENRRLEDKGRNRPDRPRVSGPAPAGVSPLTNRSTARSALPKRDAHQARLTGRRPRCAARPDPVPSRRSRRPARLRRPRTARRR